QKAEARAAGIGWGTIRASGASLGAPPPPEGEAGGGGGGGGGSAPHPFRDVATTALPSPCHSASKTRVNALKAGRGLIHLRSRRRSISDFSWPPSISIWVPLTMCINGEASLTPSLAPPPTPPI